MKLKSAPLFGANQFAKAATFLMLQADYDNNQKVTKDSLVSHSILAFFAQPQRFYLPFNSRSAWQDRYYITKVGH